VSITIPASTVAGTYYLIAKSDGDDAIAETNEANNTYGSFITIGADLVVTSLMAPDAGAGLPLVITDTTKNLGSSTAPASTTTYYLSTNNDVLDAADLVLGNRAVPSLGSGVSDTGSVTVTIPAGTPTGPFYIYAKADSANAVVETSESNNTAYRLIRVGPDLIVPSIVRAGLSPGPDPRSR